MVEDNSHDRCTPHSRLFTFEVTKIKVQTSLVIEFVRKSFRAGVDDISQHGQTIQVE